MNVWNVRWLGIHDTVPHSRSRALASTDEMSDGPSSLEVLTRRSCPTNFCGLTALPDASCSRAALLVLKKAANVLPVEPFLLTAWRAGGGALDTTFFAE